MRCADVRRELAVPTGASSTDEIADHLAGCPECREASGRSSRLDRVWEATRPLEPSIPTLDSLWAHASSRIGVPEPAVIPWASRRSRWPMVAMITAQAAAILVMASFLFRREPAPDVPEVAVKTPMSPARVTANVDETVIVRIVDGGHRVEILDDSSQFALGSMASATPHDVFSALESMAAQ